MTIVKNITEHSGYIEVHLAEAFSPKHTFECGQCFRWHPCGDGKYTGVAYGTKITVWAKGLSMYITTSLSDFNRIWRRYFDLDRSYSEITAAFRGDPGFSDAVHFGMGLRLLAQDPWEALCSFIISQCNNIKRIQSIVSTLCTLFGEDCGGYYTFPSPERIASLSLNSLEPLRAGYRSGYILNAAQAVASGSFSFLELEALPTDEARAYTLALKGVGRKVADCFLLFGMCKYDAFPVDTWMKKAKESYTNQGEFGQAFGEYAGIAQQYIFYYARSGKS